MGTSAGLTPPAQAATPHAFIFWFNGDAAHWVRKSLDSQQRVRADDVEVKRLRQSLVKCPHCRAVIFHDPLGRSALRNLWTRSTRIEYWRDGERRRTERQTASDQSSPNFLTELVEKARREFPGHALHLIYRGHPLHLKEGFDDSHPQNGFSLPKQMDRLAAQKIILETFVIASCRGAQLANIFAVKNVANFVVAPQHNVVERAVTSFDFSTALLESEHQSAPQVAKLFARHLMDRFYRVKNPEEFMFENPVSLVALQEWRRPGTEAQITQFLATPGRRCWPVQRSLSAFYRRRMAQGFLAVPSAPGEEDFFSALHHARPALSQRLRRSLSVYGRETHSRVTGLSFEILSE